MTDRHYVHVSGEEGRERLRVLARIFQPATRALLDRVAIPTGARCLDIGCGGGDVTLELARRVGPEGEVIGVDLDADKLAIARGEAAAQGLAYVEYRAANLFDLDPDAPVDLIYTRFVLTHLQDPAAALARMIALLRDGGLLIIEDADASANFCDPPDPAYDLYTRLYRDALRARGTDPDIGPRLPRLLRAAGLSDVRAAIHQPAALEPGDVKRLVALTLDSVAEPAIEAGLATRADIAAASERLHAMAGEDDAFMSMPRIVQVWGRKGEGVT